jgi:glutathione S-transferase
MSAAQTLPFLDLTSHSLCPILHAWCLALTALGRTPEKDFRVHRLSYDAMKSWQIPAGASLPFLVVEGEVLSGGLPVLQYFIDAAPNSELLPDAPAMRVHVRNRALLAFELFGAMRPFLVSKSSDEAQHTGEGLFACLARCEAQSWSKAYHLDRLVLTAAATILTSQARIMEDVRWEKCVALRRLIIELSDDPRATSTRAANYEAEFGSFFRAFASVWQ